MAKVKVHEMATKNDSERDGESEGARQRMGAQRDGEGWCLTCSAVHHRSSYNNIIMFVAITNTKKINISSTFS